MAELRGIMAHKQPIRLLIAVLPFGHEADYLVQLMLGETEVVSTFVSLKMAILGHTDFFYLANGFIHSSKLIGDRSEIIFRSRNSPIEWEPLPMCVELPCDRVSFWLRCNSLEKRGAKVDTLRVTVNILDEDCTRQQEAAGSNYPWLFRMIEFECSFSEAEAFGKTLHDELTSALITRREHGAPAACDEFEDPSGYYEPG